MAHYTATLEVTKTTPAATEIDRYGKVTRATERKVEDLARIVIRADSLGDLVEKIAAHSSLIGDTPA